MRTRILPLFVSVLLVACAAFAAEPQHQHDNMSVTSQSNVQSAANISGDYLETRSADVYTGPCFANGEVNLAGDEAILAWHINQGSWQGQNLAGLNVVAAVKASATLGDPFAQAGPVRSVLIVDEHATAAQRLALIEFARHMAGTVMGKTEKVVSAPISMQVLHDAEHHGRAFVQAGDFASVETRGIGDKDHFCGNEDVYYPPLAETTHSMPAVALTDKFSGSGLGVDWTRHDKRSAFVGSFAENNGE
jgi:hypothetical protein